MLENAKKIYCSCINEVLQHSEYMYINLEIEIRFVFFLACMYTGIQQNSVITNSKGPKKKLRYNHNSLYKQIVLYVKISLAGI